MEIMKRTGTPDNTSYDNCGCCGGYGCCGSFLKIKQRNKVKHFLIYIYIYIYKCVYMYIYTHTHIYIYFFFKFRVPTFILSLIVVIVYTRIFLFTYYSICFQACSSVFFYSYIYFYIGWEQHFYKLFTHTHIPILWMLTVTLFKRLPLDPILSPLNPHITKPVFPKLSLSFCLGHIILFHS